MNLPPPVCRRLLAAVATLAASAALAQPAPIVHQYPSAGTILSSYLDCGEFRCDIAYSVVVDPVDRFVTVDWKDAGGATLVSSDNANLWNFWEPAFFGGDLVNATEWSRGVFGSAMVPPSSLPIGSGTADFTGTSSGPDPCGIGYVCNDATYYHWPLLFPTSGAQLATVDAPVLLGGLGGRLSNVGIDADDPADVDDRRAEFLAFDSTVEFDGAQYLYRYTVTNFTDLAIPFELSGAGMTGELAPFGSQELLLTSNLGPRAIEAVASFTLAIDDPFPLEASFTNGLAIFAPVPEPGTLAMFGAGVLVLVGTGAMRRRRA